MARTKGTKNIRPSRKAIVEAFNTHTSDEDRAAIVTKLVQMARNGDMFATKTFLDFSQSDSFAYFDLKAGDVATIDKIKTTTAKIAVAFASGELTEKKTTTLINTLRFALETIAATELQDTVSAAQEQLQELQASISSGLSNERDN